MIDEEEQSNKCMGCEADLSAGEDEWCFCPYCGEQLQ